MLGTLELLVNNHAFLETYTYSLRIFDNMEAKEAIMRDREAHEAVQKKELKEVTILLEQLALVSTESGPTLNGHEFINHELKFDLKNPYIPIEEEIIGMLDGRGDAIDNEPIEKVDNVQIGDVVVDRIEFKDRC
jgi:hypothetical protein